MASSSKVSKYRSLNENRKVSDNIAALVNTGMTQLRILLGGSDKKLAEDEVPDADQRDVVLHFPRPGKIPDVYINLSELTEPEFHALKRVLDTAFEWALPVVKRRDQEAEEAMHEGNDSIARLYRPLPQVVFRQRKVGEHFERVHLRPAGVSASGRPEYEPNSDGGVRGSGSVMDRDEPEESLPEDHAAQVD